MKWLLLLFAVFALTLSAADISGTWKGSADTPMGTIERTFVFHVDGSKLTGDSTSSMTGKSELQNGKVDGDNVSFDIKASIQGNDVTIHYTGKASGDEIKLTAHVEGMDQEITYTIHRAS